MLPAVQVYIPLREVPLDFGRCLQSLANEAPIGFAVYVLDGSESSDIVRTACSLQQNQFDLTYLRCENIVNCVDAYKWAFENVWEGGNDILLLSPHTEVSAGSLKEMQAVLHLAEKHAVVTPRTEGASFFSIPIGERFDPSESYRMWREIRRFLPRYQILPAAGSFCMMIRGEVLQRFEVFDKAYGSSPEFENDLLCRINRLGYSALAANQAYVFSHEAKCSAGSDTTLPPQQLSGLRERYPEFDRRISNYERFQIDPVETFAILYSPHRPRILYDLYHLRPNHSGTSDFALNLLRELQSQIGEEYELYVGVGEEQAFFSTDLRGNRIYDPKTSAPCVFDLVYKPCQIFSWTEFARMNRLGLRVAFTLLDIIALRCDYIGWTGLPELCSKTVELSDLVFSISDFSRLDFAAFYGYDAAMSVIHLGSDAVFAEGENVPGEYLLIIGNAYAHKGVAEAIRQLQGHWPLVVLGGADPQLGLPNVRWLTSGKLSRRQVHELMLRARAVVYPSHYEGFGLPIVDSLALGKPVIVLDTAINRELAKSAADNNLHLVQSPGDLLQAVRHAWLSPPHPPLPYPRRWADVAAEYLASFRSLLAKDADIDRLRRRWNVVRLVESV